MKIDNLRYNIKKILKKIKLLKNNDPNWNDIILLDAILLQR